MKQSGLAMNSDCVKPIVIYSDTDRFSQIQANFVVRTIKHKSPRTEVRIVTEKSANADLLVSSTQGLDFTQELGLATLARGDCRDLLLIKTAALANNQTHLRIAVAQDRQTEPVARFLTWALPHRSNARQFNVSFVPCANQAHELLENSFFDSDIDGVIVAKFVVDLSLDVDLNSDLDSLHTLQNKLADCFKLVIPLSENPSVPGQGAIAIRTLDPRPEVLELLASINDSATFAAIKKEADTRGSAKNFITVLNRPYGQVVFERPVKASVSSKVTLNSTTPMPPRAQSLTKIWPDNITLKRQIKRTALSVAQPDLENKGIVISRAEALPDSWRINYTTPVWTAGLKSWRKLAKKGIWINGCFEGLGELELDSVTRLFPEAHSWLKLTHSSGYVSGDKDVIATYELSELEPGVDFACNFYSDLDGKSHFYWTSGSQFKAAIKGKPEILNAWHACGPGNSYKIISEVLPERAKLAVFLSHEDFIRAVKPETYSGHDDTLLF